MKSFLYVAALGAVSLLSYGINYSTSELREIAAPSTFVSLGNPVNVPFQEQVNSIFIPVAEGSSLVDDIAPYQVSDKLSNELHQLRISSFFPSVNSTLGLSYSSLFQIADPDIFKEKLAFRLSHAASQYEPIDLNLEQIAASADWDRIEWTVEQIKKAGLIPYYEISDMHYFTASIPTLHKLQERGIELLVINCSGQSFKKMEELVRKAKEHFSALIYLDIRSYAKRYLNEEDVKGLMSTPASAFICTKEQHKAYAHFLAYELVNDSKLVAEIGQKYKSLPAPSKNDIYKSKYNDGTLDWKLKEAYEYAITAVKNDGVLPIKSSPEQMQYKVFGNAVPSFKELLELFTVLKDKEEHKAEVDQGVEIYVYNSITTHATKIIDEAIHTNDAQNNRKRILVLFGQNPALELKKIANKFNAIVYVPDTSKFAQDRAAQLLFGAIGAKGEFTLKSHPYNLGATVTFPALNRLKFSQPEEVNLPVKKLLQIDSISKLSIQKGAYPGSQVLVAVDSKIIYYKNFGKFSNQAASPKVDNTTLYDIASVTKVSASIAALMRMETEGIFDLNDPVKEYLPELASNPKFGSLTFKEILAHQAGFPAWIPFYKKAMTAGKMKPEVFNRVETPYFNRQVADGMWINEHFKDTLFGQILDAPLGAKTYLYSDLAYYFTQRMLERKTGVRQDHYLYEHVYRPMGLKTMIYNPLTKFPIDCITPTENDQYFRKQLVHGYVHDPGAAMLGGVAGHAGIFATSFDLASVMQLYLNEGNYAGQQILDAKVVKKYTKQQFAGNRRGAGFDRPTANKSGGPTCGLVSDLSYGHSGFTGTFVWADPQYKINYVFLSNRVNPSAENWKIRDLHIRTEIQRIIYEAVQNR